VTQPGIRYAMFLFCFLGVRPGCGVASTTASAPPRLTPRSAREVVISYFLRPGLFDPGLLDVWLRPEMATSLSIDASTPLLLPIKMCIGSSKHVEIRARFEPTRPALGVNALCPPLRPGAQPCY
jgi:hypothetical protein